MTVRMIREEGEVQAPEERPPLRLVPPPEEAPAPAAEPQEPAPPPADLKQAVTIQALGVMIALANVLSIRASLMVTILAAAGLTLFAEAQHERQALAVVAAGLFTLLALIPMVALALRKG